MLSNLSPLLQLFAAMYLTMCFDETFFKNFWLREYPDLEKEHFNSSRVLKYAMNVVVFNIKMVKEAEERRMKMRGTYFFLLSVFLLIIIGFEKGIVAYTSLISLSCSYAFFAIAIIFIYIIDRHIMTRWLWVYLYVFALLVIFTLLAFKLPLVSWLGPVGIEKMIKMKVIAKILIVIAFIAPVMWQLFSNWLYANAYIHSVSSEVEKEMKYYTEAWNFNSEEDDINGIHKRYRNLAVKRDKTKSDDEGPFIEVLEEQLRRMTFPNTWRLITFSIKELFYAFESKKYVVVLTILLVIFAAVYSASCVFGIL